MIAETAIPLIIYQLEFHLVRNQQDIINNQIPLNSKGTRNPFLFVYAINGGTSWPSSNKYKGNFIELHKNNWEGCRCNANTQKIQPESRSMKRTKFRLQPYFSDLSWHQTKSCLVSNQSEKSYYNPNRVQFNENQKSTSLRRGRSFSPSKHGKWISVSCSS